MKTIVISDTHFGLRGESYSLLGAQANSGGLCKAAAKFKEVVSSIADPECETLCIVVGDMVDLAMADTQAIEEDLTTFSKITSIYLNGIELVVGNHDHHLFSIQEEDSGVWGGSFTMSERVYYPDYSPVIAKAPLYFIHGDIFDSPASVMTRFLIDPSVVGDEYKKAAAGVTAPVTELLWWLLGNMGGQYGKDGVMARIYNDLRKGEKSFTKGMIEKGLEHMGYGTLTVGIATPLIVDALQGAIGKAQTGRATARHTDTAGSRAALYGWLKRIQYDTSKFGYVFAGHTHVQDMYPLGCTNCYNMGSWVVETGCPVPDCMVAVIDSEQQKCVVEWVNCAP